MTTLILTCYNRPEYLSRCLNTVAKLNPMPDSILIMDDASTDPHTLALIQGFTAPCAVGKYRLGKNGGIKTSLRLGCDMAFAAGADLVINLDSDALVKPELIARLTALHKQYEAGHIVSGFNSFNKDKRGELRNPILEELSDCYIKKHANGINMCFNQAQYEKNIKPALTNPSGNWDYDSTNKAGFITAKPSLVQHIGFNSSMGHDEDPDVAADFFELSLPNVTLCGVDNYSPAGLLRAAEICTRAVEFGAVKMITDVAFQGKEGYSKFCISEMAKYIDTSHALIIQADGYIQNPSAWTDEWLAYDYIGASWWFKDGKNVGNGGFSLRSKKLLDILATLDLEQYHPEDEVICRQLRKWLEDNHDIKFAPTDVADRFSIEAYGVPAPDNTYSGQFGFHGYHVTGLPIPTTLPQGARKLNTNYVTSIINRGVNPNNRRRI